MPIKRKIKLVTILVFALAAMGGTSGVLLVCFLAFGFSWGARGLWSEEAAAWVQAIGSILAIGIAIVLAYLSARREDRIRNRADEQSKNEARLDRQAQVRATCLMAEAVCESLLKSYDVVVRRLRASNFRDTVPIYEVRQGREAVTRIPAHEIPYTVVGKPLLELAALTDRYLNMASEMRKVNFDYQRVAFYAQYMDRVKNDREKIGVLSERFGGLRETYDGKSSLPISADDL